MLISNGMRSTNVPTEVGNYLEQLILDMLRLVNKVKSAETIEKVTNFVDDAREIIAIPLMIALTPFQKIQMTQLCYKSLPRAISGKAKMLVVQLVKDLEAAQKISKDDANATERKEHFDKVRNDTRELADLAKYAWLLLKHGDQKNIEKDLSQVQEIITSLSAVWKAVKAEDTRTS